MKKFNKSGAIFAGMTMSFTLGAVIAQPYPSNAATPITAETIEVISSLPTEQKSTSQSEGSETLQSIESTEQSNTTTETVETELSQETFSSDELPSSYNQHNEPSEEIETVETVETSETLETEEPVTKVVKVKDETIENEDVSIYYRKLSNGQFDLIIEPKGGKNISSEWELQDMHYYKDVYLVGTPENVARKFWQTNWSDEPFLWNQ